MVGTAAYAQSRHLDGIIHYLERTEASDAAIAALLAKLVAIGMER